MKKKILHIIVKSSYAGVTTYTIRIVKNLSQYEHHIISCYKGNAYKEIRAQNIACENLISWENISYKSLLLKYYKAICFFLKNRFDIIHYHHGGIGVLLLAVIFRKKAQIIHHLHGGNLIGDNSQQDISFIHLYLLKFISKRTYQFAVADHVFNEYKSNVKSIENLKLIKNSVPYFFQKKESRKNSIGYIGRFTKEKGFKYFISVAAQNKIEQPELDFIVMGEMINISDSVVKLIPPSFDIYQFYENVDLLIFTSKAPEGLPLVVLEAISFDVGVIAYPLKGVVEILGDDYPLYIHKENGVISEINHFYSDNFNRQKLSEINLKRSNMFKFEEMIGKISSFYNSLSLKN